MIENKDKLNTQNHEIQLLCHYSYFGVFFFQRIMHLDKTFKSLLEENKKF